MKKYFAMACAVALMGLATACNNDKTADADSATVDSLQDTVTVTSVEDVIVDSPEVAIEEVTEEVVTEGEAPAKAEPKKTTTTKATDKVKETADKAANDVKAEANKVVEVTKANAEKIQEKTATSVSAAKKAAKEAANK